MVNVVKEPKVSTYSHGALLYSCVRALTTTLIATSPKYASIMILAPGDMFFHVTMGMGLIVSSLDNDVVVVWS